MVQEDTDGASIWRYDLGLGTWTEVATVNDDAMGESSGSSMLPHGSARGRGGLPFVARWTET